MSKTAIPPALRAKVAEEARHCCGYCLTPEDFAGYDMEVDHILPEALGGKTDEENLWLACDTCNKHKSKRVEARDPETGEMASLFHPRQQRWQDHFSWSPEGNRIIGLTATGRATAAALKFNREILVLARRHWITAGWHPLQD